MPTGLLPPAGVLPSYPNTPETMPETVPNIWGDEENMKVAAIQGITGTETPTPTATTPSVDVGQLYMEWAALNPNADPAAAFAAGMDAALGKNNPIGLGQMDDFSQMPGMQPDVLSGVDTFGEVSPTPEPQGEFSGAINGGGGWRDTVIDVSDVQPGPPSGA